VIEVGKIKWLGHSGFEIELNNKTVLIDPWLSGNPKAAIKVTDVKKVDIMCVTHDYGDHLAMQSKFAKNWSNICWHI